MDRTEVARYGCRAKSELVHVLLADDHRARRFEPPYDFCIFGRNAIRKQRASARRPHARRIEQILEANRNSMQRTSPAAFHDLRFRAPCIRHGLFGRHGDERVQYRVQALNPRQACGGQFFRRDLLPPYSSLASHSETVGRSGGGCGSGAASTYKGNAAAAHTPPARLRKSRRFCGDVEITAPRSSRCRIHLGRPCSATSVNARSFSARATVAHSSGQRTTSRSDPDGGGADA